MLRKQMLCLRRVNIMYLSHKTLPIINMHIDENKYNMKRYEETDMHIRKPETKVKYTIHLNLLARRTSFH